MTSITVTDASRNFSDLVSRVHYQGETALLLKGGRPMAKLSPARELRRGKDLATLWPQFPRLGREEAEALERDMADARTRLGPMRTSWE